MYNVLFSHFYNNIKLNQNKIAILKTVSFTSSRKKKIVVFHACSRFPVKLLCCVAF